METVIFVSSLFVIYVASLVAHELGHFFVAKKAGVECTYIQVGAPVLLRFEMRSTEVRVGAFPIGAWVDIPEGGSRGWKTAAFAAGPVVNLLLALAFGLITASTGNEVAAFAFLMNLALGVCNLFPIPGNDGWLVLESLLATRGITIAHNVRVAFAIIVYSALALHVILR